MKTISYNTSAKQLSKPDIGLRKSVSGWQTTHLLCFWISLPEYQLLTTQQIWSNMDPPYVAWIFWLLDVIPRHRQRKKNYLVFLPVNICFVGMLETGK